MTGLNPKGKLLAELLSRDATGAYGRVTIQSNTREYIESQGIELIAKKTEDAVETFRDIQKEETAVAALHLTC